MSRQEDLQSAIGPLQVLLIGSFFLASYAAQQSLGRMAGMLSFVPPFSSMLMPLRVAAGGAGPAQVAAALLVMLLATAALVRLADWIYAGARCCAPAPRSRWPTPCAPAGHRITTPPDLESPTWTR